MRKRKNKKGERQRAIERRKQSELTDRKRVTDRKREGGVSNWEEEKQSECEQKKG